MNFVAHACLAAEDAPGWAEDLFVFGAMLPDLASIAGLHPPTRGPAALLDGLSHHRRVDVSWHRTAGFHRLVEQGRVRLRAIAVPRGPRRAATHLGVELLLDGILVERPGVHDRVLRALRAGQRTLGQLFPPSGPEIRWMRTAVSHVEEGGLLADYARPFRVAHRVARILRSRRRFRLESAWEEALGAWLGELRPSLQDEADELLEETREGLVRRS